MSETQGIKDTWNKQKEDIFIQTVEKKDCQNETMKRLSCLLVTWTLKAELYDTFCFALKQLMLHCECNINANILFNKETKTINCMSKTTTKEN